jgi:tRNA threonylcarbamoyladenosine biosynthesis protein TsaE
MTLERRSPAQAPAPENASARASTSSEETERLGAALGAAIREGDVIALSGPLGAGKTCFVTGMVRALSAGARVRSPSFTLINEYRGRVLVLHLDLYRIEPMDVAGLGLEEQLERGALIVEWGEKLPRALLDEALCIAFEVGEGDTRVLSAQAEHGRGLALLDAWRALES